MTDKTLKALWRQFLPLSLSDVTMACSDPLVTGTLTHLPDARVNIGALGIAKAITVLFESPIIMILHTSNTLAHSRQSRKALLRFTILAGLLLTALLTLLIIPSVFDIVSQYVFHIDTELTGRSRLIISIMLLWPASIACRRYVQGLLIRSGHSKAVAHAGIGRLVAVGLVLWIGFWLSKHQTLFGFNWPRILGIQSLDSFGSALGGLAMISGIFVETLLIIRYASLYFRQKPLSQHDEKGLPVNLREVWNFYWPLANSMLVIWGGRVVLLAVIARSIDADLALAAWPAAWGLVLVIANATRMVQQIVIRNHSFVPKKLLLHFSFSVGLSCSLLLLSLSVTNVGAEIVAAFIGSDAQLLAAVSPVLLLFSPYPLAVALQNGIQGFLIVQGQTKRISVATFIGTSILIFFSSIAVQSGLPGARAAAIAMSFSLLAELLFLTLGLTQILPWKKRSAPLGDVY